MEILPWLLSWGLYQIESFAGSSCRIEHNPTQIPIFVLNLLFLYLFRSCFIITSLLQGESYREIKILFKKKKFKYTSRFKIVSHNNYFQRLSCSSCRIQDNPTHNPIFIFILFNLYLESFFLHCFLCKNIENLDCSSGRTKGNPTES